MSNSDTAIESTLRNTLAVAIYNSHAEAEAAIEDLEKSGFDTDKLSMIDRRSGRSCDRWGHQFAGLYNMGIPSVSIRHYETALQVNKFIVFAQWTVKEVGNGSEKIRQTHPESIDEHRLSSPETRPDLSA